MSNWVILKQIIKQKIYKINNTILRDYWFIELKVKYEHYIDEETKKELK